MAVLALFLAPPPDAWWLKNALVIDGTGAIPVRADVRLRDGRIREVGRLEPTEEPETVRDLAGATLVPGFTDLGYPDPGGILLRPDVLPALRQGITTVVVGYEPRSIEPLAKYAESIRARPPAVDVASVEGFAGLSIGADALVAMSLVEVGKPLWLLRGWTDLGPILKALDGRKKGKPAPVVGVSPFPRVRIAWPATMWDEWGPEAEGRLSVDEYPSDPKKVGTVVTADNWAELDAAAAPGSRLVRTERSGDLDRLFARPDVVPVGMADKFPGHPGGESAISTFLKRPEIPLPEKIRRLTSMPAALFERKGTIAPGEIASLVILDGTVAKTVWVNGRLAYDDGKPTGERAGRWIPGLRERRMGSGR